MARTSQPSTGGPTSLLMYWPAKKGALTTSDRDATAKRIADARAALLHHASVLGMTTHAANNVKISSTLPNGTVKTKILRDSSSINLKRHQVAEKPVKVKVVKPALVSEVKPLRMDIYEKALRTARLIKASKAVGTGARTKLTELVQGKALEVQPRPAAANDCRSAEQRLKELKERILAKRPRVEQTPAAASSSAMQTAPSIKRRLRQKTRDADASM